MIVLLTIILLGLNLSFLGFLLGFSGGRYYAYKRMAPDCNQNRQLSTELYKLENMVSELDNLVVISKNEEWVYKMKQGFILCSYNLNQEF